MDNHLVNPEASSNDNVLVTLWPSGLRFNVIHDCHREVVDQARLCDQCLQSGKNLKCMLTQKQVGKLAEASEQNALDFAGPFQNAKKGKKYLLVSIDHYSGWPEAKFLHCPTTKKSVGFSKTVFCTIYWTVFCTIYWKQHFAQ